MSSTLWEIRKCTEMLWSLQLSWVFGHYFFGHYFFGHSFFGHTLTHTFTFLLLFLLTLLPFCEESCAPCITHQKNCPRKPEPEDDYVLASVDGPPCVLFSLKLGHNLTNGQFFWCVHVCRGVIVVLIAALNFCAIWKVKSGWASMKAWKQTTWTRRSAMTSMWLTKRISSDLLPILFAPHGSVFHYFSSSTQGWIFSCTRTSPTSHQVWWRIHLKLLDIMCNVL